MKKLSMTKIILIILVLGLSVPAYNWYLSCWKNYSETFKEIGNPIVKSVLAFYQENQRYPSLEESEVLFEKAGCTNVTQRSHKERKNKEGEIYERWANYYCEYKSVKYRYGISVGDLSNKRSRFASEGQSFGFGFSEGKTRCFPSFHKDGTGRDFLACEQDSCLTSGWGH